MSDWTWKYVPDAANVIGGLTHAQIDEVESLASRIADAVAVRRIGVPFDVRESVSSVKSYGEGPVVIWFLEDYRDDVVLVVRYSTSGCLTRQINCVGQAVASSTAVDATITIWASRLIGASSASPCLPQRYGPVPWIRPSDCAEQHQIAQVVNPAGASCAAASGSPGFFDGLDLVEPASSTCPTGTPTSRCRDRLTSPACCNSVALRASRRTGTPGLEPRRRSSRQTRRQAETAQVPEAGGNHRARREGRSLQREATGLATASGPPGEGDSRPMICPLWMIETAAYVRDK